MRLLFSLYSALSFFNVHTYRGTLAQYWKTPAHCSTSTVYHFPTSTSDVIRTTLEIKIESLHVIILRDSNRLNLSCFFFLPASQAICFVVNKNCKSVVSARRKCDERSRAKEYENRLLQIRVGSVIWQARSAATRWQRGVDTVQHNTSYDKIRCDARGTRLDTAWSRLAKLRSPTEECARASPTSALYESRAYLVATAVRLSRLENTPTFRFAIPPRRFVSHTRNWSPTTYVFPALTTHGEPNAHVYIQSQHHNLRHFTVSANALSRHLLSRFATGVNHQPFKPTDVHNTHASAPFLPRKSLTYPFNDPSFSHPSSLSCSSPSSSSSHHPSSLFCCY